MTLFHTEPPDIKDVKGTFYILGFVKVDIEYICMHVRTDSKIKGFQD